MAEPSNRLAFQYSDIFFSRIGPVLDKGVEPGHTFGDEDAYEMLPADTPVVARANLKAAYESRQQMGSTSLWRSLLKYDPGALYASVILHFFEISVQFVSPVLINDLVVFIDSGDQNLLKGLSYAALFVMCPVLQSLFQSHFIVHCRRFGQRTQGAISCLIFEKCLRLSQPAAASFGAGALVNIMQVDTGRFDFAFFHANFMWSMPCMLVGGVILLYLQLGVAAFTPLIIMGVMYPVNNIVVKKLMFMSREMNLCRDARVKLLTEVMHAVRLVKMLAWEDNVYDLIDVKRKAEMKQVARFRLYGLLNGFIWQGLPNLLPLATFGVYVALGGELHPGKVFSSLALLDLVRIPMNLFPQALQILVQVKVGMDRIEKLLSADEVAQQVASAAENVRHSSPNTSTAIRVAQAEFAWATAKEQDLNGTVNNVSRCRRCCNAIKGRWGRDREQQATPLLAVSTTGVSMQPAGGVPSEAGSAASVPGNVPVTLQVLPSVSPLEIPKGKFVFICGSVGSGKSTLMSGLLNEVPMLAGIVEMQGPIAYCSQVPWILHGTVKDNILFGDDYDPDLFAEVVHACAIAADLEELRDGAETVIGERGINLSGGQKARISLARAAYKHRSAATFLLDDPLSAVDAHVAKHLMNECLGSSSGLLRHATRVLITHQVQYMKDADLVVVIKDGKVVTCRPPGDFTPEDYETYGFEVQQGNGNVEPASLPPLVFERTLSGTCDAATLPSEVCDSRVTALREEDCSPTHNDQLRLGDSRLPPTSHNRRQPLPPHPLRMDRSLSDGDSDAGPPAGPLMLKRAVTDSAGSSSTLQRLAPSPGGGQAATGTQVASIPEVEDTASAPRVEPREERQTGALSVQVWCTYAKTMGPLMSAFLLVAFFVANLMQTASAFWLGQWSEKIKVPPQNTTSRLLMDTATMMTPSAFLGALHIRVDLPGPAEDTRMMDIAPMKASSALLGAFFTGADTQGSSDGDDTFYYLAIYAALSCVGVACMTTRMAIFRHASLKVSRNLHAKAMWAVMRSPMYWLDTTPTGQIVNRFSQDIMKLDLELTANVSGFIDSSVNFLISLVVIATLVPFVIVVLAPVAYFYSRVQRKFRATARELQRLASLSRSPIYQGLDEAIIGVSSIRAYEKQELFAQQNARRCTLNLQLNFNIMCCNRWLALRLRSLGTIPVMVVAVGLVLESRIPFLRVVSISGATVGIALRYALQLVDLMQGLLMNLTQTELGLVALERIRGYTQLAQEPPLKEAADTNLGVWPTQGTIEFCDVTMRYREDLPRVLNGISFKIPGGTSVGVVGRTGAGKSSLLQALFRMCPLEGGAIFIDGVDIWSLGLHTMRRRLAIIPQDPVGFTGSLRFNLDPFEESTDEDLWKKLASIKMEDFVRSKTEGLDFHLSAGGENLSVGQRQLICAARALLRGCRILILDEATASVDFLTDTLIQEVLREEVTTNKLTTLTIAHRINTILGSDNVLVMEKGVAAEFGPTQSLAQDPKSMFYTFVHAADDH